jgi:hypothetical protein
MLLSIIFLIFFVKEAPLKKSEVPQMKKGQLWKILKGFWNRNFILLVLATAMSQGLAQTVVQQFYQVIFCS